MLLILKYVLWTLTNVLAIVGTWFVKFTEDGEDGRKRLTRWGRIGLPMACLCFLLALVVTIYGDIVESRRHEVSDTDKEKFSPRLDIYVGPLALEEDTIIAGDPVNSKYYIFVIRNLNKTSVPILNLIMNLSFSDSVVRIRGQPCIGTLVAPVKAYAQQTPDTLVLEHESLPADLSIFKTFSFEVRKDKIKDRILNTNIVMFSCSSWPAESNICFSGDIVTAPGGSIEVSSLGRPGSYHGQFFYEIKGQTFSEKLSGKIVEQLEWVK
jgi:hypothetical protein